MTQSVKTVFEGRIIKLNLENVILPNGVSFELEVIHHPGGVAILATDDNDRLCVLRQYRHAVGGWLWEIPAGKREPEEEPDITAQRELLEEVGVEAAKWKKLGKTATSPGIFTEIIHLYLATNLTQRDMEHEEEEVIEVHWFTLDEVRAMVDSGEIYDAKTLIALYKYERMLLN